MSGDQHDYQLISSLRYDKEAVLSAQWNTSRNGDKQSPYLLLSYTVDRLITAAKAHSWVAPPELTLDQLESRCNASLEGKDPDQSYKVMRKNITQLHPETHDIVDSHHPFTTGENFG